jgi:hypothetical protein
MRSVVANSYSNRVKGLWNTTEDVGCASRFCDVIHRLEMCEYFLIFVWCMRLCIFS